MLVGTMDPTVDSFSDTDGVIGALAGPPRAGSGSPTSTRSTGSRAGRTLVGPDYDHPTPGGPPPVRRKLAKALRALS